MATLSTDVLVKRSTRSRNGKPLQLAQFVRHWIITNTTPSSNSQNVVRVREHDLVYDHVKHWRTESLHSMYLRCRRAAHGRLGMVFKFNFFYKQIPSFVRLKKKQDGLCPLHYTGHNLSKEFRRKRAMWHQKCKCTCSYCSGDGCDHGRSPTGGKCSYLTCLNCANVKCPLDWNSMHTTWFRPIQSRRTGGGLYWVNQESSGTRSDLSRMIQTEMEIFNKHHDHVLYHKEQMESLMQQLEQHEVIIKSDFIQNIVHSRGQETSQSYYGKRQTQFLTFVVYYIAEVDGELQLNKLHVDYLSSYLNHNSLFFQKCAYHVLQYLMQNLDLDFTKVFCFLFCKFT